jgi:hypothetical protein
MEEEKQGAAASPFLTPKSNKSKESKASKSSVASAGGPLLGKRKQREDDVLNEFYTLVDNKVIQHNFEEGTSSEIVAI